MTFPSTPAERLAAHLEAEEQDHDFIYAPVADLRSVLAELAALKGREPTPVPMILHCPACGLQHVDAPEESLGRRFLDPGASEWTNPPHRSHLCQDCGHIWRPADVATEGVASINTKGSADSEPIDPSAALAEATALRERLREAEGVLTPLTRVVPSYTSHHADDMKLWIDVTLGECRAAAAFLKTDTPKEPI